MIILYGCGPGFGLPEISPYCTKTEVHLKMAGLKFTKRLAEPEESPKGQLPFIEDGRALIADSHFIRLHIERKYQLDLDEGLSSRQRAEAWAIERMVENHLGYVSGYYRWLTPANFEKGPGRWFDGAPAHMREQMKQDLQDEVRISYRGTGILRHSESEILGLGLRSLAALDLVLADQDFLFGPRVTSADAITFAMLAGILTPFFDSPLRREAEAFGNLVAYTDRMMRRYFPEHAAMEAA